jgi:hypothetical protein
MSSMRRGEDAGVHQEISALLPWYVNGTCSEGDRLRVDAHLPLCAVCSEDLARERYVRQCMTAEASVEYMPAASLKRLLARLDGAAAGSAADRARGSAAGAERGFPRRPVPWHGVMAASVAVLAVAMSLLAADRWIQSRARSSAPDYHTVTTAAARAPEEVIRAVFAPTITLVELQAVLDEAGLRIVSGPSDAGVYSLAANSRRPVSASLALLRAHANVRFAESIQGSGAGDTQ